MSGRLDDNEVVVVCPDDPVCGRLTDSEPDAVWPEEAVCARLADRELEAVSPLEAVIGALGVLLCARLADGDGLGVGTSRVIDLVCVIVYPQWRSIIVSSSCPMMMAK